MRATRILLALVGVCVAAYGVLRLLDLGPANLVAAAVWLVVGVLVHDAVIGPLTIAVGALGLRLLSGRLPAPVIVGGVVFGSVTLLAVPVLGRFGARADNPTLLDRPYLLGWTVFAALTWACVAVACVARTRGARARRGER